MIKTMILIFVIAVFVFGILPFVIMSIALFNAIMVRDRKRTKWARGCSAPEDPQAVQMFNEGMDWARAHEENRTEVEITSCGYKLKGEYFDFGKDKAVIIIPGRTETLLFSYYYIQAFADTCNVLVIDNRSHGDSEGRINCIGYKEYEDILNWGKLLHEKYGNRRVILHGICVGCCTALFTLTSPGCPDYMCGMIAEGMYATFGESFKLHMKEMKKPTFPLFYLAMLHIRIFAGADVMTDGPLYRIDRLKKPVLFLHSRADTFSLPVRMDQIYEKCTADKKLVWFDQSRHSRIRFDHTAEYDREIGEFLKKFS